MQYKVVNKKTGNRLFQNNFDINKDAYTEIVNAIRGASSIKEATNIYINAKVKITHTIVK